MRVIKTQKGFTIVETMIVVGVTGVLLFITMILVSGQVQRYSFRESSLNMEQTLAGAINDVRVGYFPPINDAPASCIDASATSSGDTDCIYAGKRLTVDATNRQLKSESVYVKENTDPLNNLTTKGYGAATTVNLPSGLDYDNDLSFFVLYNRFGDRESTGGSGQSIVVYKDDFSLSTTSPLAIKASNGDRQVVYCVGKKGVPTLTKDYSGVCP